MPAQDNKDSMQTPPAPAFDGNGSGRLSGDLTGKPIAISDPKVGAAPATRDAPGLPTQPNPCGGAVGVMAPVQGLEKYGVGKVIDAPSTQARVTPDTAIANVNPLASDMTPGY